MKKYNFFIFTVIFSLIFGLVFCWGYFRNSQSTEVGKTTIEVPVSEQNPTAIDKCSTCECESKN